MDSEDRLNDVPLMKPLKGIFVRIVGKKYAPEVLSTAGARFRDGRYHIAGQWNALYLSEKVATAWSEIKRHAQMPHLLKTEFVAFQVWVKVSNVVDLTDVETLASLNIDQCSLISEDVTACQHISKVLRDNGVEAIIAPSAANPAERNLIIFADRLKDASRIEVVDQIEI